MLNLSIPEHVRPIRDQVLNFIEQEVYPVEKELVADRVGSRRGDILRGLMDKAKAKGLWALGHPEELGGGGLPFMDYVFVNEVVGRSEIATVALGTHSLQDSGEDFLEGAVGDRLQTLPHGLRDGVHLVDVEQPLVVLKGLGVVDHPHGAPRTDQ